MWIHIKHNNFTDSYPLICRIMGIESYYDKYTGKESCSVELKTMEDLITFDSVCKASNPLYKGFYWNGDTITINERGEDND